MAATSRAVKSFDDLQAALAGEPRSRSPWTVYFGVNSWSVILPGIGHLRALIAFYQSTEKFLSAVKLDGFGFAVGWDIHDAVYSKELLISNKANGYHLSSFRRIPWENNVPFFLVSFLDPVTKTPLPVDPRGVLKTATDRISSTLGYECFAGVEYEYFNFKETAQSASDKSFTNLQPLTPGSMTQLNNEYFNDLFDESSKFDVPIEGHRKSVMADNAILFKYTAKSIGMKHGVIPSFMAKPWNGLPGCSGHVHVSLRNAEGRNIFAVSDAELKTGRANAANEDTKFISQEAEWFLAGILDGIADEIYRFVLLKCIDSYAKLVPTINGYKRLVGGEAFWAPNAVTYGYDSRAASILRIPGADMNPYFTLSAIFSLGLRGINKKLALPGPPISHFKPEDRSNGKIKLLPTSLESATARMMRPDSIAREPEVFGNDFVDHYGGTREHEVKLWNEAVTNWELTIVERYLELA
ncbi:hypothetical protein BJ912DRAFT_1020835 [Pholiota molesta]|nr:hypothetical protein BJ912DRAFT_1020835 [Pholiota molesta]